MKESSKFEIAAIISAVTTSLIGVLTVRKLPDFDKDVDYTKLTKSKDDVVNIAGKSFLSFGVDMIFIVITSFSAVVSFWGSKYALDNLCPTKEEEKELVFSSKPMLNEKEIQEIGDRWKEKNNSCAWQEKLGLDNNIPSRLEKGLKK